jgi:hypothetical protein
VGQVPAGQGPPTEEREIDVVGVNGNRVPLAIGMCKWTNAVLDVDELNLLDRLAPHIDAYRDTAQRYLFSRSGFSQRLVTRAASDPLLHLLTPADIYTPAPEN